VVYRPDRDPEGLRETTYDEIFVTTAVSHPSNFRPKFASDSIHVAAQDDWGHTPRLGISMGAVFPPQDNLDDSAGRADQPTDHVLSLLEGDEWVGDDDSSLWDDDEHTDDSLSLLEENARLRGLVVTLSNLLIKNVAEQK
jgi:hypothetical protein